MLIRLDELNRPLQGHQGTRPGGNPLKVILTPWRYNRGRKSAAEFGKWNEGSIEGPDIDDDYMDYAIKPSP
jgi:hypothetical protein